MNQFRNTWLLNCILWYLHCVIEVHCWWFWNWSDRSLLKFSLMAYFKDYWIFSYSLCFANVLRDCLFICYGFIKSKLIKKICGHLINNPYNVPYHYFSKLFGFSSFDACANRFFSIVTVRKGPFLSESPLLKKC